MSADLPQAEAFTLGREKVPEPAAYRYWSTGHSSRWQLAGKAVPPGAEPLYTAAQLQSALLAQAAEKDAEIERLRADAARYRWLRDDSEWIMFEDRWLVDLDIYGQGPNDMDAAIDASRALAQKEAKP